MSRRFKEAGAPTTSPGKLPPQRGDQGGRRARNNDQSHTEMEQDAPVLDEVSQGAGMELQQTVSGTSCAERRLGATVQASIKSVQQSTELTVSSADLSRLGKNNSLAHNPESSTPEIVSSLPHCNSSVLLNHEGLDSSVTTANFHTTFNTAREICPFVFLAIFSTKLAALFHWLRHCLKHKEGTEVSIFSGTKSWSTLPISQGGDTKRWPTRGSLFCLYPRTRWKTFFLYLASFTWKVTKYCARLSQYDRGLTVIFGLIVVFAA